MLNNVAKKYVGDKEVDAVRGAYENRARWYYYLVREGLDKGLPLEFARDAMLEAGKFMYEQGFKNVNTIADFAEAFMNYGIEKAHEGQIISRCDTCIEIALDYCPLVNAWSKLNAEEAFIADLCGACMETYRGIAEKLGWTVEQTCAIGKGDATCTLCFKK